MFVHAITASILFLALSNAADIPCPINEEFNYCDTACPPDCQSPPPQVCTDECIQRCSCKQGFIRQSPGAACVESCEGVPVCGENEIFSNCSTLCPPTCERSKPVACPAICLPGCVCQKGYIRNAEGGNCIPNWKCPKKQSRK